MPKTNLYVQYGCWKDAPQGWDNYDSSPFLVIERLPYIGKYLIKKLRPNDLMPFPESVKFGDILKGLPNYTGSCDGVYCSHILEHLSKDDCLIALKETRRLLSKGGVFRFVLPDLNYYVKQYVGSDDPQSALSFMKNTGPGEVKRHRGLKNIGKELLGGSRHRWMWGYKSLSKELSKAGFSEIRRAEFGDSIDSNFSFVEKQERWDNCLGIECRAV